MEKFVNDFLEQYDKQFKEYFKEIHKNKAEQMFILYESFKPIQKVDKPYSTIIRSNNEYDKNDFKLLEKVLIWEIDYDAKSAVMGMTYISPNILGFLIQHLYMNRFVVYAYFNGGYVIDINYEFTDDTMEHRIKD